MYLNCIRQLVGKLEVLDQGLSRDIVVTARYQVIKAKIVYHIKPVR